MVSKKILRFQNMILNEKLPNTCVSFRELLVRCIPISQASKLSSYQPVRQNLKISNQAELKYLGDFHDKIDTFVYTNMIYSPRFDCVSTIIPVNRSWSFSNHRTDRVVRIIEVIRLCLFKKWPRPYPDDLHDISYSWFSKYYALWMNWIL